MRTRWFAGYVILIWLVIANHTSGWKWPIDVRKNPRPSGRMMKWIAGATAACSLLFPVVSQPSPAFADNRLNAPTAVGTRVNSDPESLLRYGLPINSIILRNLQENVEAIKSDLRLRRSNYVQADIFNVRGLVQSKTAQILNDIPTSRQTEATTLLNRLREDIKTLAELTASSSSAGAGSVQEREALDQSFIIQDSIAKTVGQLEELAVPENYHRFIPEEYQDLPRLNKRATVAMKIIREDGSKFDVLGKLFDEVDLKMVVDGYNSPITAGNFVDLVNHGFYNGLKITRSDGFVVQTGDADPSGKVHGYVPKGSETERTIPLEIALKGDEQLLFGATSEEEGRGASATVLPFQAYGALGMARAEYEADSASSQFFWLLFESDLTPAGKNLLDGRYACFGYTVEGQDLLKAVKEGDVIKEAKVIAGLENLQLPKE